MIIEPKIAPVVPIIAAKIVSESRTVSDILTPFSTMMANYNYIESKFDYIKFTHYFYYFRINLTKRMQNESNA